MPPLTPGTLASIRTGDVVVLRRITSVTAREIRKKI
jgi:hypothetical protein